jgi:ribosomal protein S24E
MKVEISGTSEKKLIGRKDVDFAVTLEKPGPTPTIIEVKKLVAAKGGFDSGGTVVVKVVHRTGTQEVRGLAHVYPSEEEAKKWEPKHVMMANLEMDQKKQALEQLKKARMEAKAAKSGTPGGAKK